MSLVNMKIIYLLLRNINNVVFTRWREADRLHTILFLD